MATVDQRVIGLVKVRQQALVAARLADAVAKRILLLQRLQLIHTPGHTPGSQCFLVQNRLIAGDTLFLQGCGRTDLPGGDPRQLYLSLSQKLAKVPDSAILYPGHLYDPRASASLGETRRSNFVFKPKTEAEWLSMFG